MFFGLAQTCAIVPSQLHSPVAYEDGAIMVAFDRCQRCVTIAASWFGKTFDQVLKRVIEKQTFKDEWDEAKHKQEAVDAGDGLGWPWPMELFQNKLTGFRTEMIFWFLAVLEFHKLFSMSPAAVGLAVVTWPDETGHPLKGVFVKPDGSQAPDSVRRVIMHYDSHWEQHEIRIEGGKRLRLGQVEEAFAVAIGEENKKLPKDRLLKQLVVF
jgi:hypothetical protein